MIKVDNDACILKGNDAQIMAELSIAISEARELFAENCGEKYADMLITEAGRIAYMSEEEMEETAKLLQEKLKELEK